MILILTGPVHSGKTTLLKRAVRELNQRAMTFTGYLSEALYEKSQILGYDLYNIHKNQSVPFLRKEGQEDWERIGAFFVLPEGLAAAKKIILDYSFSGWLIVDEIGPLELSGKGIWPVFKQTLLYAQPHILCVVRRNILADFISRIERQEHFIFDIHDEDPYLRLSKKLSSLDNSTLD